MPLRHNYIHLKPFEWCRDVSLSGWSFRSISVYDERNVLKMLRCRATMVKWTFLYVEIRFRLATQYRHLPNVCTRYDYVRLSLDCCLCYNTIVPSGSPGKLTCNVQYWDQVPFSCKCCSSVGTWSQYWTLHVNFSGDPFAIPLEIFP